MLAFLAALTLELRLLRRQIEVLDKQRLGGSRVVIGGLAGKPILLCAAGVGRRSQANARALIQRFSPQAIVCIGFAGALKPQYRAGHLLLCQRCLSLEGDFEPGPAQARSDQRLLGLAEEAAQQQRLSYQVGISLTVPKPIESPQEKAQLGQAYSADAVEMESFWVGRVAEEEGVPFLAARAISDEMDDRIPDYRGLYTEAGAMRLAQAALLVLAHPSQLPPLLRLWAKSSRAVQTLTSFAVGLASLWQPAP